MSVCWGQWTINYSVGLKYGHETRGLSCFLTHEAVESEVTSMDLKMYACAVAQSRALDAVLLEVE